MTVHFLVTYPGRTGDGQKTRCGRDRGMFVAETPLILAVNCKNCLRLVESDLRKARKASE